MMLRALFAALCSLLPLIGASLPQVTAIDIREDAVILKLSKPLLSTPKRSSIEVADKTKLKFYVDVGAQLAVPAASSKTPSLREVKVAQFDKQTVRVVVLADKNAKFELEERKDAFVFRLLSTRVVPVGDKIVEKVELQKAKEQEKEPQEVGEIVPSLVSKRKTVVIDAGHGGKDPGALGLDGTKEKDIVLKVAQILAEMLEKRGYSVYMTRENDIFIELQERTRFANKKNADVFVSIHANAIDTKHNDTSKFHGIETYFLSPARSERAKRAAEKENGIAMMDAFSKETFLNFLNREKIVASNKLAIDIQRGLLSYSRSKYKDTTDGGVKEAPFWVLVGAQMPAVLVELGYLTHEGDLEKLRDDYYKVLLAKGIMEGIENYFQNN